MPAKAPLAWCAGALFFAALYVLTIRDGHTGGDFALYILHAGNLVHGAPYAATGFVPDAANTIISPASYPPGFPLLLAPIYAIAGMDIHAFKLLSACLLLALLPLVHALVRPALGPALAAIVAIATGVMPALFDRRDLILSDIPFTAWCFAAMLCCEAIRHGHRHATFLCATMAGCVAMACATRPAGAVLVAAICLIGLARRGPHWRALMAAAVSGLAAATLAGRMLHVDGTTYLGYFAHPPGIVMWLRTTLAAYGPAFVSAFGLSFGAAINAAMLCGLLLLLAAGWLIRVSKDAGAPEAFLPLYLALLAIFPVKLEPLRYLVPVAPLLLYYPCVALRRMWRHRPVMAPLCAGAFFALAFVPYYAVHNPMRYPAPSVMDTQSQAMFAAIRARAGANDLLLAANPRVLVLMTGRRASIWPAMPRADQFWTYADHVMARYAITDELDTDASNRAAAQILAGSGSARLVWRNLRFSVWQLAVS